MRLKQGVNVKYLAWPSEQHVAAVALYLVGLSFHAPLPTHRTPSVTEFSLKPLSLSAFEANQHIAFSSQRLRAACLRVGPVHMVCDA